MNPNKDYYQILGVLEDAEDIVIKAAYRALAQKYHPDKFQGNPKIAEVRMQEINEAYSVLSDPITRKEYDETRVKSEYQSEPSVDEDDLLKTLEKDWAEAIGYFPDLVDFSSSLSRYSKQLEYTYKILIIEGKNFNRREEIAKKVKQDYLEKYFGTNKKILEFAEMLFKKDRRDILAKLNRAVSLLGSKVDPSIITEKLIVDLYPAPKSNENVHTDNEVRNLRYYAFKLFDKERLPENLQVYYSLEFLGLLGIRVHQTGIFRSKYDLFYEGKDLTVNNTELVDFAVAKAREYMHQL